MKWQGQRQSVNVIDLRTLPKTMTLLWWNETPDGIVDGDPCEFLIDTDGLVYFMGLRHWTSGGANSMNANTDDIGKRWNPDTVSGLSEIYIGFVPAQPKFSMIPDFKEYTPTLTSGQKYALKVILKQMLAYVDKTQITLKGQRLDGNTYLLEYAQTILNNN